MQILLCLSQNLGDLAHDLDTITERRHTNLLELIFGDLEKNVSGHLVSRECLGMLALADDLQPLAHVLS